MNNERGQVYVPQITYLDRFQELTAPTTTEQIREYFSHDLLKFLPALFYEEISLLLKEYCEDLKVEIEERILDEQLVSVDQYPEEYTESIISTISNQCMESISIICEIINEAFELIKFKVDFVEMLHIEYQRKNKNDPGIFRNQRLQKKLVRLLFLNNTYLKNVILDMGRYLENNKDVICKNQAVTHISDVLQRFRDYLEDGVDLFKDVEQNREEKILGEVCFIKKENEVEVKGAKKRKRKKPNNYVQKDPSNNPSEHPISETPSYQTIQSLILSMGQRKQIPINLHPSQITKITQTRIQ